MPKDEPGIELVGEADDLTKLYADCEGHVVATGDPVHIFERISTGKPVRSVEWNGRRRPGAGA